MKNKIYINKDVAFDTLKLLESRAVFLANSGGGKSYAIRRFSEEACEQVQTIIIDPEGEFASLREQYDFILAGKNADVPVEVRSAALLATRLLELGKSAVIDLYELHPQERQRYVKLFCEALINAPKELYHPVFIVLDEAHEYAPEGKPSEATYAVEALASKGRKRGYCLIPATQRISKLSKNISAECNNKLIGRASQDIDMKRAGDELGFTKERLKDLRLLKPGEFFAFGPAISDEVIKVKIGPVKTTHAKVGYKGTMKTPPPSAVIKKVLGELADLPQEAEREAKTVVELKKENSELKRKMKDFAHGNSVLLETTITPEDVKKIVNETEDRMELKFWEERNEWLKQIQNWFNILKEVGMMMQDFEKNHAIVKPKVTINEVIKENPAFSQKILSYKHPMDTGYTHARQTDYVDMKGHTINVGVSMGTGEKLILTAIAQFENGITTDHIAVLTGYKSTSRKTYLQRLMSSGLIEKVNGFYFVRKEGIEALGSDYKPLPTGHDLTQHYINTLPEGEKRIFQALYETGSPMKRKEIELATNYKATSVKTYLQRLTARKIVESDRGMYILSGHIV